MEFSFVDCEGACWICNPCKLSALWCKWFFAVDSGGAEKLAGNGDMLLKCPLFANDGLIRLQGAFIDNKEIKNVIEYIRNRYPQEYDENFQQCLISKETQIDEESQEERREKAKKFFVEG